MTNFLTAFHPELKNQRLTKDGVSPSLAGEYLYIAVQCITYIWQAGLVSSPNELKSSGSQTGGPRRADRGVHHHDPPERLRLQADKRSKETERERKREKEREKKREREIAASKAKKTQKKMFKNVLLNVEMQVFALFSASILIFKVNLPENMFAKCNRTGGKVKVTCTYLINKNTFS